MRKILAYSQNVLKLTLIFFNQNFLCAFLFVHLKQHLVFIKPCLFTGIWKFDYSRFVTLQCCFQDKFREEVLKLLFLFVCRNKKTWIWDFSKSPKERKGQSLALSNQPSGREASGLAEKSPGFYLKDSPARYSENHFFYNFGALFEARHQSFRLIEATEQLNQQTPVEEGLGAGNASSQGV